MTGLITRYVREFRDDPMTDPTMMYVNHQDWVNVLASTNDQSGKHLFIQINSGSGEFTVDADAYDARTFILKSIVLGSDLWKSVSERFNIPNPSFDQFYNVREIHVEPSMTEYRVTGIGVDGSVEVEPVGVVECVI